jgi:hypothetical protein
MQNGTLLRIFDLNEPGGSRICYVYEDLSLRPVPWVGPVARKLAQKNQLKKIRSSLTEGYTF